MALKVENLFILAFHIFTLALVSWQNTVYRCRGDVNFAIIDTAGYIDFLYTWSAFNTENVRKFFAGSSVDSSEKYSYEKYSSFKY